MKKIIIIGCPGSGKSTFSKALENLTGLSLYHLDMLKWNSDKTTVSKRVFEERLDNILEKNEWIIDGNYISTMDYRMKQCDTVFFLDYPLEVCLSGIKQRIGKKRSDMPWIEENEDPEFMDFIKSFDKDTRPEILNLLKKYAPKNIIIFKNREDVGEFLRDYKYQRDTTEL